MTVLLLGVFPFKDLLPVFHPGDFLGLLALNLLRPSLNSNKVVWNISMTFSICTPFLTMGLSPRRMGQEV